MTAHSCLTSVSKAVWSRMDGADWGRVGGTWARGGTTKSTRSLSAAATFVFFLLLLFRCFAGGWTSWNDFHYAYDNGQVSGQQIYEYVALKPGAYFVCTGAYVMYVVDPAGFTVQLDINGDYTLSTCDNSDWDWDVDADHGGCVLGNCTPLAANATLTVVDLTALLDDDGGAAGGGRRRSGGGSGSSSSGGGRAALVAAMVFVAGVVVFTAFRERSQRKALYRKLPDDDDEDTSHLE